jgi:hypothetical protein
MKIEFSRHILEKKNIYQVSSKSVWWEPSIKILKPYFLCVFVTVNQFVILKPHSLLLWFAGVVEDSAT